MTMMSDRKIKTLVVLGIVAAVLLVGLAASLYTVQENEYACVMRFGELVAIRSEAGLHARVPFIEQIQTLPKMKILYNMKPSEVLTGDKKAMIIDNYVLWRINDPLLFMRSVSFLPEMEKRIDASVYSRVKNLLGTMEQSEIITDAADSSTGRGEINRVITELVSQDLTGYGVQVLSVEIKRFDLPPDNAEAVFNRMVSERQQMAAAYRAEGQYEAAKIRNEADKTVTITLADARAKSEELRGSGEAEFMRILSEAYGDADRASYYLFIRELDALSRTIDDRKVLILTADSPLARILAGTSE